MLSNLDCSSGSLGWPGPPLSNSSLSVKLQLLKLLTSSRQFVNILTCKPMKNISNTLTCFDSKYSVFCKTMAANCNVSTFSWGRTRRTLATAKRSDTEAPKDLLDRSASLQSFILRRGQMCTKRIVIQIPTQFIFLIFIKLQQKD